MQTKTTPHLVDIKNSDTALNMVGWCLENLDETEWVMELTRFSPSWYRFKFYCDQNRLMAILNS